jgi:hypothetical protein
VSEYVKIKIGDNASVGIIEAEFKASEETIIALKELIKKNIKLS